MLADKFHTTYKCKVCNLEFVDKSLLQEHQAMTKSIRDCGGLRSLDALLFIASKELRKGFQLQK